MTPERWRQVQEVLLAALERPPAERAAFLDRATPGDSELRREVESLIVGSETAETLIEGAVQDALELATMEAGEVQPGEVQPGARVGPYEVVREIGEGGLSKVYLAQRADEHFTMRVAIKVVKRGMDTDDILRRLRQERQILAALDHPNIARIFDGGSTDDGLPYFVMEYIEGEPIDAYCEGRGLSVDARLELFRKVCSAAHTAHQSLVIHRDIKPSNILVTDDGVPKLLDFGIAKLLDPEASPRDGVAASTVAHTVAGMRLLTPSFASPEQMLGQPLTTATDVYSLGVLLYHLLTGQPPYRIPPGRAAEAERIVCESEPPPPSSHLPELDSDLDNIVLMALRKEPTRRYASVEQLAEDLERFSKSLPVLARQDTLSYRTTKFIRRNRGAVTAGGLVLAALLGGLITTIWQAQIARRERARAEVSLEEARTESARAGRVSDFLVDIFEISDPGEARGNRVTAREVLDQGAEKIRLELGEDPELRSRLMVTMGRVYRNLGLYDSARALFEEVLGERRQDLGEEHAEVASGLARVADVARKMGEYDVAEGLLQEALGMQRRLLGEDHLDVAATLHLLATVYVKTERVESAEELLTEALEIRIRRLGDQDLAVADSRNRLAELYYSIGQLERAKDLFGEVLAKRRAQLGNVHPKVASSLNNLAAVRRGLGELEPAIELFREVLELRRQLFGDQHPDVAASLNNLGTSLQAHQRWQEAIEPLSQALAMNRELLGDEHPVVAVNMNNLASSLRNTGDVRQAEELLVGALAMTRRLYGNQHSDVALNLFKLASLYAATDRPTQAIPLFEESVRIMRQILAPGDFRISYPLAELARVLCARGDTSAAGPLIDEAIAIRAAALPADHRDRVAVEDLQRSCG